MITCRKCGYEFDDDGGIFTYGRQLCPDCFTPHRVKCNHCGMIHEAKHTYVVRDEFLCPFCYEDWMSWYLKTLQSHVENGEADTEEISLKMAIDGVLH